MYMCLENRTVHSLISIKVVEVLIMVNFVVVYMYMMAVDPSNGVRRDPSIR